MDPYIKARHEQGVDAKIVIMGNTGMCLRVAIGSAVFRRNMRPQSSHCYPGADVSFQV